jgi:hypothetical protein
MTATPNFDGTHSFALTGSSRFADRIGKSLKVVT